MNAGRAFVGAVLVGIGALFLLDGAGALDAGRALADWWPLGIVLLGAFQIASERRVGPVTGVLVVGGLLLLGGTTGLFGAVDWGIVWPILLITAGGALLLGWGRHRMGSVDQAEVSGMAVLSSSRVATRSDRFRRAAVTAVLGGLTLDLTKATPVPEGASVSATAVFGGIDVVVPTGWVVTVRGLPLFGGWDDTTARTAAGPDAPHLEIQALVLFGGLEVKHPRRWR
ncbi:MAG: cell wall-active antibiotics response protein [Actinobacteria bacterium]|nr:cell wall-active antibiotics response protein [Actinomycetota bacterium]